MAQARQLALTWFLCPSAPSPSSEQNMRSVCRVGCLPWSAAPGCGPCKAQRQHAGHGDALQPQPLAARALPAWHQGAHCCNID